MTVDCYFPYDVEMMKVDYGYMIFSDYFETAFERALICVILLIVQYLFCCVP